MGRVVLGAEAVPLLCLLVSRCLALHPFPPREQLLAAVVLGADLVVVPASP